MRLHPDAVIGSDGIGRIVTVETTPARVAQLIDTLNSQPDDAWEKFAEAAELDGDHRATDG